MERTDNSGETAVDFRVNGVDQRVAVEPRHLLADVLRDQLDLTGTHVGCEQGVCGACIVMMDGQPVNSCLTLAVEAEGRAIDTVEHVSRKDGALGTLERSFMRHGAFQCGFCTPGFLVMGHHILELGIGKDKEKVREYLSGNVCRCTGYDPIVEAIVAAATEIEEA